MWQQSPAPWRTGADLVAGERPPGSPPEPSVLPSFAGQWHPLSRSRPSRPCLCWRGLPAREGERGSGGSCGRHRSARATGDWGFVAAPPVAVPLRRGGPSLAFLSARLSLISSCRSSRGAGGWSEPTKHRGRGRRRGRGHGRAAWTRRPGRPRNDRAGGHRRRRKGRVGAVVARRLQNGRRECRGVATEGDAAGRRSGHHRGRGHQWPVGRPLQTRSQDGSGLLPWTKLPESTVAAAPWARMPSRRRGRGSRTAAGLPSVGEDAGRSWAHCHRRGSGNDRRAAVTVANVAADPLSWMRHGEARGIDAVDESAGRPWDCRGQGHRTAAEPSQ